MNRGLCSLITKALKTNRRLLGFLVAVLFNLKILLAVMLHLYHALSVCPRHMEGYEAILYITDTEMNIPWLGHTKHLCTILWVPGVLHAVLWCDLAGLRSSCGSLALRITLLLLGEISSRMSWLWSGILNQVSNQGGYYQSLCFWMMQGALTALLLGWDFGKRAFGDGESWGLCVCCLLSAVGGCTLQ